MTFAFNKQIGPVKVEAVISERDSSRLKITEIPVELGADITDHAFVQPKKVTLDCATYNAAATYNALVAFQATRVPFTFVSGLFVYNNMLIKSLEADRDRRSAKILRVRVDLKQIILVSTASTPGNAGTSSTQPGGANSRRASTPTSQTANGTATKQAADIGVKTGDAAFKTPSVAPSSLANSLFGG